MLTDEAMLKSFEDVTLPFEQWTHRAPVRVCYLYLLANPFDEAMQKIRRGIKAYNAHNHVPESATTGYNETTTVAFAHLIAATIRAYRETHPVKSADEFCDMHPQLMTKHALRLFYSPQQRMHPLAKSQFIQPDLAPLPRIE
jgi:hypothetical protein